MTIEEMVKNCPHVGRLYVTVGLPRSGKSTLCQKALVPHGYVVVNPDNFRLAIHGQRFLASAEPFVWASVYAAADALLLTGHKVVIDGCHMTQKRREPWESRKAEFLLMCTSKEDCISRALAIDDHEIIPVIERMAAECDWPTAIGRKSE